MIAPLSWGRRCLHGRCLARELHMCPRSQCLAFLAHLGQYALWAGILSLFSVLSTAASGIPGIPPRGSHLIATALRATSFPALIRPKGVGEAEYTRHTAPSGKGTASRLPRWHGPELEGMGTVVGVVIRGLMGAIEWVGGGHDVAIQRNVAQGGEVGGGTGVGGVVRK